MNPEEKDGLDGKGERSEGEGLRETFGNHIVFAENSLITLS